MLISYFEEYPTKENLQKLNLVTRPTKLYLAAYSLKEFLTIKKSIKSKHVKEIIYWPLLPKKDGYWVSPFTKTSALKKLFSELLSHKEKELSVMLDLELPKERHKMITRIFSCSKNKRLIKNYLLKSKTKNIKNYTVEVSHLPMWVLKLLGITYDHRKYPSIRIAMYYTSFSRRMLPDAAVRKRFKIKTKDFAKQNMLLGVGTIATGVLGWEPILKPKQLEEDLTIAKKNGIKEAVIFRLGGLNKEYVKVINSI